MVVKIKLYIKTVGRRKLETPEMEVFKTCVCAESWKEEFKNKR
jgi:hypothetical protein